MPLTIGDTAAQFTAFDVITNKKISLSDYAGQIVVLAFEGFSWCPACHVELWALQKVWEQYQNSPLIPKVSVIVAAAGEPKGSAEDLGYITSSASNWGLTYPILNDPAIVTAYSPDIAAEIFIINTKNKICNIIHGTDFTDWNDTEGNALMIIDAIIKCGASIAGKVINKGNWAAFAHILFGIIQDGGGLEYGPGGNPIPVDPLRISTEMRDVLTGLGMSEIAKMISDKKASKELRLRSLRSAQDSLKKLIANAEGLPEVVLKSIDAAKKISRQK